MNTLLALCKGVVAIAMAIIFIPVILGCIIIGLLGYCFGRPITIKINGETRKYRWNKKIA